MKKENTQTHSQEHANKAHDFLSKVTGVKAYPVNGDFVLKANCTIIIDNIIAITGFKLIETASDIFVTFPNTYNKESRKSYPNAWLVDMSDDEKAIVNDKLVEWFTKDLNCRWN